MLSTINVVYRIKKYYDYYTRFMSWKSKNKVKSFSENVFPVYFDEISKSKKESENACP